MNETLLKVSITGATGFVGSALVKKLMSLHCFEVLALIRQKPLHAVTGIQYMQIRDLAPDTDWQGGFSGVDVLVHTAARVHVMNDTVANPLTEFRRVNVDGTLNLAQQAAAAGVRRFVFISSIKVNGEATQLGCSFKADDVSAPLDAYGVSKMEAEQGLRKISDQTGMDVTILRPTLVYGPGVKANFADMMRWLQRGVPLPLGAIHNQRSLVALDNLVDLIVTCLTHPAAANQTFLVSDGEDLSTTQLLRRMGAVLGKPARLIPVPVFALKFGAALVGKPELAQRLCGSLQIDMSKTQKLLRWTPPFSVDESLQKAAEGYLRETAV